MNRSAPLALVLSFLASAAAWSAETGCEAFKWDVSKELAVMREAAKPVNAAEPARIEVGTHYRVRLAPQAQVPFAAPPEKSKSVDGAQAGLLTFRVPQTGIYRVSITSSHWADVVDGGKLVTSRAHEGHAACDALHKIVEFQLEAGRDLILQLSGAAAPEIGVAVTRG